MTPGYADVSIIVSAAAFGLVFGSFSTALSYRLPRGESIAKGRSKCTACGHTLTAPDLVPVFSWIAHGGKCRHCRAPISWRYPAIEILMATLFAATVTVVPDALQAAILLGMTLLGVTLGVIDLEHQRLPNSLVATLAALALIWRWANHESLVIGLVSGFGVFAGAVALSLAFKAMMGRAGLGMGDAKLFAVAGLALAPGPSLLFFCMAGALGVVTGLFWRWRTGTQVFPFAPAILGAFWLAAALGSVLLRGLIAL